MKAELMDAGLFIEWLKENVNIASSTEYVYRVTIMSFLKRNPDIDEIESYNQYLIEKTYKLRNYCPYYVLKHWINYKFAKQRELKEKLIQGMAVLKPKLKDIKQARKHQESDKLMEIANNIRYQKHKIIAIIQTFTGVRAGDILQLKRGSITIENYKGEPAMRIDIIGKGEKRNVVYIYDETVQEVILCYITNAYTNKNFYFLEEKKFNKRSEDFHALLKYNYLEYFRDLKIALDKSGVRHEEFASHDFRRAFARRCWTKWKDVHVLMSMMNHSHADTTFRYLKQSGISNIDYHKEMQEEMMG